MRFVVVGGDSNEGPTSGQPGAALSRFSQQPARRRESGQRGAERGSEPDLVERLAGLDLDGRGGGSPRPCPDEREGGQHL